MANFRVAEHKSKSAPGKFSKVFPEFAQFFTAQKRTKDARMSSRGSPKVLLPFVDITEKQEKRLPPQAMFFSQINLESRAQEADGVFESDEIFIQSISDDYRVSSRNLSFPLESRIGNLALVGDALARAA